MVDRSAAPNPLDAHDIGDRPCSLCASARTIGCMHEAASERRLAGGPHSPVCASIPTVAATADNLPAAVEHSRAAVPELNRRPPLAMSPPRSRTNGTTMNWDIIEGNWKQLKGLVRRDVGPGHGRLRVLG
jgi:hypothetical protein